MSRSSQFTLKTMLWLMLGVASVLTAWAMLDLVGQATDTGDLPYAKLLWMGVAYVLAITALATRHRE